MQLIGQKESAMPREYAIKVDEKRGVDGTLSYGATVTERYKGEVFSSFYNSHGYNGAVEMAKNLAISLRKTSHPDTKIDISGLPAGAL